MLEDSRVLRLTSRLYGIILAFRLLLLLTPRTLLRWALQFPGSPRLLPWHRRNSRVFILAGLHPPT